MDPVTLGTLAIGAIAGTAASGALSGGGGDTSIKMPETPTPAQDPAGAKPSKKSTQPSFLAGASMLPQGGASPGGKTLLGA